MRSENKVADRPGKSALISALFSIAFVLYPLIVYFGLSYFSTVWVAVLLLIVCGARFLAGILRIVPAFSGKSTLFVCACIMLLALFSIVSRSSDYVLYAPVLMNVTLLFAFGSTLFIPPSAIERFARIRYGELPPPAQAYARKVTMVWCGFFVINGSIALYTVLFTPIEVWTLYNGGIAYVLIGALFAGEWLYRQRVRRGHES